MAFAIWNAADKGAGVTLSGANLLTSLASATQDAVRANVSKASGKWYWEVTIDSVSGSQTVIGVANASAAVTGAFIGSTADSLGYAANANIYHNFVSLAAPATYAAGDVISVAYDADAGTVAFRKNNGAATTISGADVPTGALFPAISGVGNAGVGTHTTNFGDSAFVYTPPTGFVGLSNTFELTHAMTGGVSVAGDAEIFPPDAHPMTGGAKVGSDFTIYTKMAFIHAMTGGVKMGGIATVEMTSATIFDEEEVTGGILFAGEAVVGEVIPVIPTGGMAFGGSAIVLERIPHLPEGGLELGGTALVRLKAPLVATGGMEFGGAALVAARFVETPSGGVELAGDAIIDDYQAWFMPSGGMEFGGAALAYFVPAGATLTDENPFNDEFPGLAVNLESGAPSHYARLPANSFCRFFKQTYVANAGGIYRVGADDDAGQPIRAMVDLPTTDYDSENDKRVHDVHLALRATGRMRLHVATNNGARSYYDITRDDGALLASRVKVGQGLRGRYWGWGLSNVEGCDFTFDALSLTPRLLTKHGR